MTLFNTHDKLGWAFLTGAINETDRPISFYKTMFFGDTEIVPAETLELSYFEGQRRMAPFVAKNGEAVSVDPRSTKFANVSFPNIRVKRPMEAYDALTKRMPGQDIFATTGAFAQAASRVIAEDTEILSDVIDNREEWMCAKMAQNRLIEYSVSDMDSFKITMPYDATNMTRDISASGTRNWATGSAVNLIEDFQIMKRNSARYGKVQMRNAVFGRGAATAWMNLEIPRTLLDNRRLESGRQELQGVFDLQGVYYMGTFMGIDLWEYSGTYTDDDGNEQDFQQSNQVTFLPDPSASQAKLYYGLIPDTVAIEQGLTEVQRFSKSWQQEDPSARIQLVHTRPLPVLRRPNTIYNLIVAP